MTEFIQEPYNSIMEIMQPIIQEHNLDEITMESIVRSCVEVEEKEIQRAKYIRPGLKGEIYSTKLPNIKINLEFIFSTLNASKAVVKEKSMWMGVAVIYLVYYLFKQSTVKIENSEIMSLVLFALYRLRRANVKETEEYVKQIAPDNMKKKVTIEVIEKSLCKLEELKCISLIEGKYILIEKISPMMFK